MMTKQTNNTNEPSWPDIVSDTPLASIIIPTYNHASFVGDAIYSVLAQDYENFEIIVVDDGSTDDTRKVLSKFEEQITYIWQKNQGLSAARNTGISAAKGGLIGILDADDMYETDYLSCLVSLLVANPDVDGVYCGYRFVDEMNQPLYEIHADVFPPENLFTVLLQGNLFVPESMFLRKECYIESGPFDTSLRACEDWDRWLTVSKNHKIIGTKKVLTRHRILSGSMSSNPDRMYVNRLAVVKKHFGEPSGLRIESTYTRQAYGGAYRVSCIEYLQYGDLEKSWECFNKMALSYPNLLLDTSTFYELGCGDQSKGNRGQFESLNLERNSKIIINFLDKLFDEHFSPSVMTISKATVYATAYYTLGLLEYGVGNLQKTRDYFLKSIKADPRFGLRRHLLITGLKSILGKNLKFWLKHEMKTSYQSRKVKK